MTITEVISLADQHGVKLWATWDGKIGWRCRGDIPESVKQSIRANREEVLAWLQQREEGALAADPVAAFLASHPDPLPADVSVVVRNGRGELELVDALALERQCALICAWNMAAHQRWHERQEREQAQSKPRPDQQGNGLFEEQRS